MSALDARLRLYASPEVGVLADRCFKLITRYWASYSMRAPIEVGEYGMYNYRFDQVRGVGDELAAMAMRVSLGGVHSDLSNAIEQLEAQMRAEL